jgi:hypothetical protein
MIEPANIYTPTPRNNPEERKSLPEYVIGHSNLANIFTSHTFESHLHILPFISASANRSLHRVGSLYRYKICYWVKYLFIIKIHEL